MLLSANEYLSYRTSYWKKLKNAILRKAKSFKVVAISLVLLIILVLYKIGYINSKFDQISDSFYSYTSSIGLKTENIFIEGLSNLSNKDIMKQSGIKIGDPILKINVWKAKEALEKITWIKSVNVVKEIPGNVYIKIVERTPIAIWQYNKKQYMIDSSGFVISANTLEKYKDLIVVVGDSAKLYAPKLLEILSKYKDLQSKVVSAIYVGDRRWNIRLKDGPEIKLPETAINDALKILIEYDQKHHLTRSDVEIVDMRIKGKIYIKRK